MKVLLFLFISLFLIGCVNNSDDAVACTADAKLCPDGTAVGRSGPNCEFAECPSEASKKKIVCDSESRLVDFCTQEFDPVCGWSDSSIQCIKYPCASTYSNGCTACKDSNVEYYTKGECPQ